MSTSRREFLLRAMALGGAAAAGTAPGCAQRIDPAPVADVPEPVGGKLSIAVDRYPDLQREGGAIMARARGLEPPVLVTRLSATAFSALSALCTHAGCPVGYVPEDAQVACPCHGSRFNAITGKVEHPPARQGLLAYVAEFDPAIGLLTVDLVAGDPDFPAVQAGKVVLSLSAFPQLAQPGGVVSGIPRGLGRPLMVIALAGDAYTALDGTCTHQGCTVEYVPAKEGLECPCHGSRFTLDGAVANGPATRPLTAFTASRVGDAVVVQVA